MIQYPKRLIEVDLPIKRISAHARREKSIRHGHISTLHIWWARRPLAACRAVICAALWPDPEDLTEWAKRGEEVPAGNTIVRPNRFLDLAKACMTAWAIDHAGKASAETYSNLIAVQKKPETLDDPKHLRRALLDFIADFANWDNSTDADYLPTARMLTQAAHEALGGEPGTRPLVVDPFAGGGSIPLEALRVGADAFASDLNPVAVLLNKVVLEYIPKYGQRLADEVRKWGTWIKEEAEKELAQFYPKDPDGATPIAYLWARTIRCEGPSCGAEVPLIRSLWLAKKPNRSVALQLIPDRAAKRVDFRILVKQSDGWADQADPNTKIKITSPRLEGTVKSGSVTCPCCGYTIQNSHVRNQLATARGGAATARLTAVALVSSTTAGRSYRLPTPDDENAAKAAAQELALTTEAHRRDLSPVPDEPIARERPSPNARGLSAVTRMGVERFGDLFAPRQGLAIATLNSLISRAASNLPVDEARAVRTVLALSVSKIADLANSCCRWEPVAECPRQLFARQAVPIVWDFPESVPIAESSGSLEVMIERFSQLLSTSGSNWNVSEPHLASATNIPLPDDGAEAFVTDPPYYDAVPYGDLSDFFYVWLRRALRDEYYELFSSPLVEKDEEAIWNPSRVYTGTGKPKDQDFYEWQMGRALGEGRRVTAPAGIGVVVFAHKSTAGWEAILSALIGAGWIATASWPVDTEMGSRVNAMGTASLASSVHIVCRPRENPDGSVRTDEIGDWRDVLDELPRRIHAWLPRLADEGIVGADAIFACLGPALEIFSRYARVEKASGEQVSLREYLEQVWAAVAREALSMIFAGAETTGFEADARLTAMWLWTLSTAADGSADAGDTDEENAEEEEVGKPAKLSGFVLEYDAARKIAQGLGAHLDKLPSIVEVKGDKARLLPVAERARALFGKEAGETAGRRAPKAKPKQMSLFAALGEVEEATAPGVATVFQPGETALDRLHQAMLLFAAGRGEALKRFLVEDGVGRDQRLWRLAQSLSALYPPHTEEKRWVDGVLARKKGLGL